MNLNGLRTRDREIKNGEQLNEESRKLTQLYRGRARELTIAELEARGQGDPEVLKHPFQTKILKRLVHMQAVIWSQAPTREPTVDREPLPERDARVIVELYRRANVNASLKSADRWRVLLGQCVLYWGAGRDRPVLNAFQPHLVMRDPSDIDQTMIEADRRVAFQVRVAPRREDERWHFWERQTDGRWLAFRCDGGGAVRDDDELYPGGAPPFGFTPFRMLYDEPTDGQAWIPIDETRTAFALGLNVLLNEIAYLLKQEAHTAVAITGIENQADLPAKWGPGKLWGFEEPDTNVVPVSLNPKLLESVGVSRHFLEQLAIGEGLPADMFLSSRRYESGVSGKLRREELIRRRLDQVDDAHATEALNFSHLVELNNVFREQWGTPMIESDIELGVEFAPPWFPVDSEELQRVYHADIERGLAASVDYIRIRDQLPSREAAERRYDRIQLDRERYPMLSASSSSGSSSGGDARGASARPPEDPAADDNSAITG